MQSGPKVAVTHYVVMYDQPKPKFNLGIGIKTDFFLQNQNFQIQTFLMFPTSFLGI